MRDPFVRRVFNKIHRNRLKDKNHSECWGVIKKIQLPQFPPNSPNRQRMSNCLLCLHKVEQYSEMSIASEKARCYLDLALHKIEKQSSEYKILFNPVNSELGTIPNRTNKIFKNRILNLSNPGQELNVNKILRANNFLFKNCFLRETHTHTHTYIYITPATSRMRYKVNF